MARRKEPLFRALPGRVANVARLRGKVIAWTKLDPYHEPDIFPYFCCRVCGPFLFVPCLWPHLIVCCPCLTSTMCAKVKAVKSQYWILTERELKVVTMNHDVSCCPGVFTSGDEVKTIPLENITDAGIDTQGNGCANVCTADLPVIYVDTASSDTKEHEATALGLASYQGFIDSILDQRDNLKHGPMDRGGDRRRSASRS